MTAGLAGALKNKTDTWVAKYYQKILPKADIFTSYSNVEIDFFEKEMKIPKEKIQYMPLGTDWNYFSEKGKKKKTIISAVGVDSGRDYKTLFKAVKNLPYKVEIACHPNNIRGLTIPDNVTVHINIPVNKIRDIYRRSLITIVPCFERYRSAGQMVLLEAASSGLPVIASKIFGITGAFKFEDKKHLLFFTPENPISLRKKIGMLLKSKNLRVDLGKEASIYAKNNYTTKHLALNLSNYIDNL